MTTTTLTKNARTLIASTSNASGATTRGTLDLRTAQGGILFTKITNGATGPTTACVMTVSAAPDNGATPTAGALGADWKKLYEFAGTTTNGDVTHFPAIDIGPGVQHLQVEFTGNTGQAVTVEALFSEITSAASA